MAPVLFIALRVVHILDGAHYPISSRVGIENALQAIANDPDQPDQFSHVGIKITSKGAKHYFLDEFLPVVDSVDLLRKLYQATEPIWDLFSNDRNPEAAPTSKIDKWGCNQDTCKTVP